MSVYSVVWLKYTGKVATGHGAVPASRQLNEENVERSDRLTATASQSATTQSAFPALAFYTHIAVLRRTTFVTTAL